MDHLHGEKMQQKLYITRVVLEEVAKMAYRTEHLKPEVSQAPQYLQDKHFFRKHGENAYYGQGV